MNHLSFKQIAIGTNFRMEKLWQFLNSGNAFEVAGGYKSLNNRVECSNGAFRCTNDGIG